MKSKKNIYIAIGMIGVVVGGLLFLKQTIQKGEITKTVVRKEAGEGGYTENLYAEIDGEENQEIEVQVEERLYTQMEIKEIFREEKQKLEDYVKGENESLDRVVYPLVLKSNYGNSKVEFSFYSDKPDLLNWDGELLSEPDKDGSKVHLFCEMTIQNEKEYWEREISIYPAHLNRNQQIQKEVQDLLRADEQKEKKEVFLPNKIDGKNIRFYRETDKTGLAICLLSVCTAAGIFVREREKKKEAERKRQEQLRADYPDFLQKLILFLQAGLSVRSSMNKIAVDYLQIKERKEKWERPVYEEVQRLCKEIQGGVPETEAYEKFGKRCKIAEYRILSVLLVQNLKKGSQDILLFLEREAAFALENRKRVMKVKGEQASTKLVFPMMIQLMLIFGVLMVPAFLSFVS